MARPIRTMRWLLLCLLTSVQADSLGEPEQTLETGTIRLVALLSERGEPMPGTHFALYREHGGEGQSNREAHFSNGPHDQATFEVPAGDYLAVAQHGSASSERQVQVIAGEHRSVQLNLNAGMVKLSLVKTSGGPALPDTWFEVLQLTSAEGAVERVPVAVKGHGRTASFTLPVGHYMVSAHRPHEIGEAYFSVDPQQAAMVEILAYPVN